MVVTQPDRKKGRHLHLAATPVKTYALEHGLELFQPEDINASPSAVFLKNKIADIFIVVSYGRILSKDILALPLKMPVNIHASLLPKYRGAAPINRALMSDEKKTGVTFIRMNERMDEGDIILSKALKIDVADNAVSLEEKLSALAAETMEKVLDRIVLGKMRLKKQVSRAATLAPLMKKRDGLIDWTRTSDEVVNQYRGCAGWPGTYTIFRGKILKILSIKKGPSGAKGRPGEILRADPRALGVACAKGSVLIAEVLPESHKKMDVRSFLAGHQVKTGEILGR